jgi:hypothetical protein
MLAGVAPVSGPTARAIIAKLLTEKPASLRTFRDSVSPDFDAALLRALAKTPADRFASVEGIWRGALGEQPTGCAPSAAARPQVARRLPKRARRSVHDDCRGRRGCRHVALDVVDPAARTTAPTDGVQSVAVLPSSSEMPRVAIPRRRHR